jgi:hypothetical protein
MNLLQDPPRSSSVDSSIEKATVEACLAKYQEQRVQQERQTAKSSSSTNKRRIPTATEMKLMLHRMEHKILKAAKVELAYLNKAKKLRDERKIMTQKYDRMCHIMQKMLKRMQEKKQDAGFEFTPAILPPLFEPKSGKKRARTEDDAKKPAAKRVSIVEHQDCK